MSKIFLAISQVSDGNMSYVLDNKKIILENRKRFFSRMNIEPKQITEVKQVHSNKVIFLDSPLAFGKIADGFATNNPKIILMVKSADCMAITFFDPKQKAIALTHAGFKGLESGIIKNTIDLMKSKFKTNSKDLLITISPSIGPCHYRMDLWGEAEKQLTASGVLKKNIDNPKTCTYENLNYFSHRRSQDLKTAEGRFVTIAGLC